jgi:hypothetical protein
MVAKNIMIMIMNIINTKGGRQGTWELRMAAFEQEE